jgi:hypothetical protein
MFISSPLASDDITYAGNIGHPFVDVASDDALGYIYMLNSGGTEIVIAVVPGVADDVNRSGQGIDCQTVDIGR